MILPHGKLSPDALNGVIEEYVTRDGTEHSDVPRKSTAVRQALDAGDLVLVYDPESDSCNILPAENTEGVRP